MTKSVSGRPPAVVLLSGGLDSSTVLAIAREQGFEPYALSFRYGQRHIQELEAAEAVARTQGAAKHVVAQIDLREFGGSALTAERIGISKGLWKARLTMGWRPMPACMAWN
jgi:7-cyano-7-deazaguanine synthase in queuosine biosynthesis